jgi:hypothetical protein
MNIYNIATTAIILRRNLYVIIIKSIIYNINRTFRIGLNANAVTPSRSRSPGRISIIVDIIK